MATIFNAKKNATNIRKNGISLAEADGVLNDPLALTVEDTSAIGEQRFATIGANILWSVESRRLHPSRRGSENHLGAQAGAEGGTRL